MKVFKFGGASVKDAAAMKNVASIISRFKNEKPLVVISALGKTTNALEEIADAFFKKNENEAAEKIDALQQQHFKIVDELFDDAQQVKNELLLFLKDLRGREKFKTDNYNLLYDQVVSTGELLSTKIMAAYLLSQNLPAVWLDARQIIKTDQAYREPKINWPQTTKNINENVKPLLSENIVITQGFIGSTSDNFTTTLGREGSDFTAAIFSNILEAEEQVIWKDVPGVLNANPKEFPNAVKIEKLPYEEAVEMTYYGAQVIHPKTIKPLQNKKIPLHVRSFIESEKSGTIIKNIPLPDDIPPIIVFKRNQVLLQFSTKDFSFMAEQNLGHIIEEFAKLRIKTNVMQNAAISMAVVIDFNEAKLQELTQFFEPHFNLQVEKNVEVLTIRHYNDKIVDELIAGKDVVITQKTKDTVQFVYR